MKPLNSMQRSVDPQNYTPFSLTLFFTLSRRSHTAYPTGKPHKFFSLARAQTNESLKHPAKSVYTPYEPT